jgi:signal peptidase II
MHTIISAIRSRIAPTGLALFLVFVDLATKYWAQTAYVTKHGPTPILPFLSLVLAFNPGLTFGGVLGIFENRLIDTLLTTSIATALCIWMWRERRPDLRLLIAFAAAGALGNTIDRALNTMVTDFLQFHFGGKSAFVVNLADIWILIAVTGLLWRSRGGQKGQKPDGRQS